MTTATPRAISLNLSLLATLALSAMSVACINNVEDPDMGSAEQAAVVATGWAWKNPADIPVCFLNRADYANYAADLRDVVTREYHTYSPLRLTGWGDCSEADFRRPTIRVEFTNDVINDDPWIQGYSDIGATQGRGRSMILLAGQADARIYVHEFAHAVGLYHEHEREDSEEAATCRATLGKLATKPQGGGVEYVGAYDPYSITSYCMDRQQLSDGDIQGLQRLYPNANWDKFVRIKKGADCVAIQNGDRSLPQEQACGATIDRLSPETWIRRPTANGYFRLENAESHDCLRVSTYGTAGGVAHQAVVDSCTSNPVLNEWTVRNQTQLMNRAVFICLSFGDDFSVGVDRCDLETTQNVEISVER